MKSSKIHSILLDQTLNKTPQIRLTGYIERNFISDYHKMYFFLNSIYENIRVNLLID